MTQASPRPFVPYENYPTLPIATAPRRHGSGGVGRGSVAGMAVAALTTVGTLPTHFVPDLPVTAYAVVLAMYSVLAAVIGAAPGAVAGWLISALARAGATPLPVRLAGGLSAAIAATVVTVVTVVTTPFQLLNWPGLVIATLCGAVAAPWVAWGRPGPTLS